MKEINHDSKIKTVSSEIKNTLQRQGFLLSKTNPFFDWVHGAKINTCMPDDCGLSFYIVTPPIPPISPFDYATILISFESLDMGGVYFQLTFYFHNALVDCLEASQINEVYEKHDRIWFIKLADYLADLEEMFHLTWETEYDETIEDNLYGRFPLDAAGNIIAIMQTLKDNSEEWQKRNKMNRKKHFQKPNK